MQNLPTEDRPSTKILEDLIQVRKRLVAIEGSDEPFIKKLKPLQRVVRDLRTTKYNKLAMDVSPTLEVARVQRLFQVNSQVLETPLAISAYFWKIKKFR